MMRSFNYGKMAERTWDQETLALIAAICRSAGRQELFLEQAPEKLDALVEIAKIQSTKSSNAIEGIVTTDTRLRQLVLDRAVPKNRSEQEINGYRDALNIIHENFDVIPITKNYILQLHKIMYAYAPDYMAGRTRNVQNYISAVHPDGHAEIIFTPPPPSEAPGALDAICSEYAMVTGNMEVEPLLAIPVFIHDFLSIHPFNDGNGRMSRLLTTLLLYRAGFTVGRYISLEEKIARDKDLYYSALARSQAGWHEGKDDPLPFIKYTLGIILAACRDFEERFRLIAPRTSAAAAVRAAAGLKVGRFTKRDILDLCPALSVSSVEGALRALVAEGFLRREGTGRATRYVRLK